MFVGRSRAVSVFTAGVVALAAACGGSDSTGTGSNSPAAMSIVSGNGQVGLVGTALASPLVVKVTSSSGTALAGIAVQFSVQSGAATVAPGTASTDATGQAKATVTLGSSAGNVSTAAVVGSSVSQSFVVTAGDDADLACRAARAQTPAAGGVLPSVSGTGVCLGAAAGGSDYAPVTFFQNRTFATPGQNVTAPARWRSRRRTSPARRRSRTRARTALVGGVLTRRNSSTSASPNRADTAGASRSGRARGDARCAVQRLSTLTLNQIVPLNANGTIPCSSPINIGARVAAISNTAYVLADRLIHGRPRRDCVVRDDVRPPINQLDGRLRPADGHRP